MYSETFVMTAFKIKFPVVSLFLVFQWIRNNAIIDDLVYLVRFTQRQKEEKILVSRNDVLIEYYLGLHSSVTF